MNTWGVIFSTYCFQTNIYPNTAKFGGMFGLDQGPNSKSKNEQNTSHIYDECDMVFLLVTLLWEAKFCNAHLHFVLKQLYEIEL